MAATSQDKFSAPNGVRFAVDEFVAAAGLKPGTFSKVGANSAYFQIQKPNS
jgi:hypothetical protein